MYSSYIRGLRCVCVCVLCFWKVEGFDYVCTYCYELMRVLRAADSISFPEPLDLARSGLDLLFVLSNSRRRSRG